jgi:hypothetical protein
LIQRDSFCIKRRQSNERSLIRAELIISLYIVQSTYKLPQAYPQ